MKERFYLLFAAALTVSLSLPITTYANVMGRGAMMGHGYGGIYYFFYVICKVAVVVAFFWLLLRIARALEEIAKSKSGE
ncbi:MAG: hypothetical protein ACE5IH_02215 [Thermodesulfobacteriota bacterium]